MSAFRIVDAVVLAYFVVGGLMLLALQAAATRAVANRDRVRVPLVGLEPQGSSLSPRVSALIPAHNEGPVVVESVRAMLTQEYPALEVIVINDGSTDDTFDQLHRAFNLQPSRSAVLAGPAVAAITDLYTTDRFPNLIVVNRLQGGKAAALNTGVAVATGELVCAIDADTIVDPGAISLLVQPFLDDEEVVAAGGARLPAPVRHVLRPDPDEAPRHVAQPRQLLPQLHSRR
ncbi:MAG: glycosyltransferase family 2 protein [Acidimicrobiia bacterium]